MAPRVAMDDPLPYIVIGVFGSDRQCAHQYILFLVAGSQPPSAILYPAEAITAYQPGRPIHTGHGLAFSSSRLAGSYGSTVAGPASGYLTPSGTLSAAAAATTTGTLQPLSHVPSVQSSQFHYIANPTGVHPHHGHTASVASVHVTSPGSHSGFSGSRQQHYAQVPPPMNLQYLAAQQGTIQLQPSVTLTNYNVGYHSAAVISTSAPSYTQQQQLSSIHPVTGTAGSTPPSYSAPDTFTSSQVLHQQAQAPPQQSRSQWNSPSGY